MEYNYILNSDEPESWGNEAYNGMEISREELERLAAGWDVPIEELLPDLISPYDQLTLIEYLDLVRDYSSILSSLADGWTEKDVLNDFKNCIKDGGDGFLNTLTEEQLCEFAESVARDIEEHKGRI